MLFRSSGRILLGAAFLVFTLSLAACESEDEQVQPPPRAEADAPLSMSTPGAQPRMQEGRQVLTLQVTRNGIRPVEARLKAASPVRLYLERSQNVRCPAVEIPELDERVALVDSIRTTWDLQVDTTGRFVLRCEGAGEVLQAALIVE